MAIEKSERGERCTPLNLDLTCLRVNSSLEDSLAVAASVLGLVKSIQPTIITIQCLVAEESLDYLLFKKLPGNTYDKQYIKSPEVTRSANTCIAWNTYVYSATPVDLVPVAMLFPQTNLISSCMVHLWPKNSGYLFKTLPLLLFNGALAFRKHCGDSLLMVRARLFCRWQR